MLWIPRPLICVSPSSRGEVPKHKAAVKLHTLLDLHGNIPSFIHITDGKVADVRVLDEILPEPGAFYVMDRGYIDFERLFVFTLSAAFRGAHQIQCPTAAALLPPRRQEFTGVRSDQTVVLSSFASAWVYPDPLRRVSYLDVETKKRFSSLPTTSWFLLDDRPNLQVPLASGTVLQVDQATPADKYEGGKDRLPGPHKTWSRNSIEIPQNSSRLARNTSSMPQPCSGVRISSA